MIKIGIIGVGRIGKVHSMSITRYVKDAKIVAVADPYINEETIEWAKNIGIVNISKDYHDILNNKEVDAVLICSSTDTHSKISIEAINAKKHVFCEKPVDHDLDKIQAVISALKSNPTIKYQVGFNRRFDHNFMAVKEAIHAGKLGDVRIIKICSRDPGLPPIEYIKVSGGIFLDMAIHDFDMVRYLSDSEVTEVYAIGGAMVDPKVADAGDIDTAIITMKLKNGAIAVIDNCREATYGYDQRVEVFGSLGQIAIGNDTAATTILSNKMGVTAEKPLHFFLERYTEAYVKEINDFISAIVNNTEVEVGVDAGLMSVVIGLAAKKSLQTGLPVKI